MAKTPGSVPGFPTRLLDLDPRTVELLARLNEEERRTLIELSNLSKLQLGHLIDLLDVLEVENQGDPPNAKVKRLGEFLSLTEPKWRAGFDIVTNWTFVLKVLKATPWFVIALVALMTAAGQLWTLFSAWFRLGGKG